MSQSVGQALDDFFARFCDWEQQRTGGLPRTEHDARWPSPACAGEPDGDGLVAWQPVRQRPQCSFADLENALDAAIHPDIAAYFTRYYAAAVSASFDEGGLTLLFAWNDEDFRLLTGNIIGHALEKRRVRQPLTVFFANIDDNRFLSVDNATGQVMLEVLGARRPLELELNLAEFLERLSAPASHQ